MQIAIIGLGRMGANMARRLMGDGHEVVVHNRSRGPIDELAGEGATPAYTIEEIAEKLSAPRVVWLMVPAGSPVDEQIDLLVALLSPGDLIVDGGNSRYLDSIARAERVTATGIHYIDSGTSGGIWGLELGFNMMVGGTPEAVAIVAPALASLAPPDGWLHVGPSGAGHYVKMIHNGIEYGVMQAYAEGFEILENSRYDLDLRAISQLWNNGSVIRSWLLELAERAFAEDPHLESIRGYVQDSGEGRWTVFESIDLDVAAPVIYMALATRFLSRQDDAFSNKVLAALRNQFGGHAVQRVKP
jgi:6-phosphogluconate dehydrogenase